MKFNIGDRVQTKLNRTPGTVRWISECLVAVETDDPNYGVPLPRFEIQHGLFLSEDAWEKISPSKIVITSDGKTTLARLYDGKRVIRRAEAKCSTEDTYDFATGANLAYDRLMQPARPTAPANKYDAMSDDELVCAVCDIGMCSASKFNIRHADCPFKNTPAYNNPTESCSDYLHAHPELRPVLVQYLADEDAAKEPKPEPKPVKLYCVGGLSDWLTRGKIYESFGGRINVDTGENYTDEYMRAGGKLYPLVSRPAKAGEWVLITKPGHVPTDANGIADYKKGDILKIIGVENSNQWARYADGDVNRSARVLNASEYEVLDGYDGRYEEPEKPKYLSGKVVCVETHDDFTVGKVYTFKDGKVTDDSWNRRPMSSFVAESLEDWNSRCGDCIVRFVEYKGEA